MGTEEGFIGIEERFAGAGGFVGAEGFAGTACERTKEVTFWRTTNGGVTLCMAGMPLATR